MVSMPNSRSSSVGLSPDQVIFWGQIQKIQKEGAGIFMEREQHRSISLHTYNDWNTTQIKDNWLEKVFKKSEEREAMAPSKSVHD